MTHFTDEETEAQLSPTLCPESQLVRGRRWTQPQGVSSNPDALRGVPGPRQALSKGGFSSLREAVPSNRETPVLDLHCEGGGRRPALQSSTHAGTQQGGQGWKSGRFPTHRPAGPSASPAQTPAFSSGSWGVSVPPLHGPDEEVMDGGVTSHPSFWSCRHRHCHRLPAVGRCFWARATPHVPPQSSRRTRADFGWDTGPSCFLIVPVMDASSPARQEGGPAKPCAQDSPPKLLLGVAPLGPFHTDVCLTRK